MDKPEPVTPPAADAPPRPTGFGAWLAANLMPLAFVALVLGVIVWKELDIWPVVLAVLGLGLVIFIHELGHFVAAKLCDVHVETFSIGFGKAIPGLQFRRGETFYKVGWVPLGGYVKMVGEGENADTEEADEDPRSFKNKPVWQRMVIISAGVIMNLVLGCICFMVAYSHGVEETRSVVGAVTVGSPAWQSGVRADEQVVQIDRLDDKVAFEDIRPAVMSAAKGEPVLFRIRDRGGNESELNLVPRKNPEDLYPTVGILPAEELVLQKGRKSTAAPVRKNSPAERARAVQDGSEFRGGDRVVGSSYDPANPKAVKAIGPDPRDPAKRDTFEFLRNQHRLRGQALTVQVDRGGTTLDFVVEPAWTRHLPGVRLQMGRLAALRTNGPAARPVAVDPPNSPGLTIASAEEQDSGDKITKVEVSSGGQTVRYVETKDKDEPGVQQFQLDPLRLGHDLEKWFDDPAHSSDRTVRITIARTGEGRAIDAQRVTFDLQWDPALVHTGEVSSGVSAPASISGLGLAYHVGTTVDAGGAPDGLQRSDVITHVRPQKVDDKGNVSADDWIELKSNQGMAVHNLFQLAATDTLDVRVKRGESTTELTVKTELDPSWSAVERGLIFPFDTQVQVANGPLHALRMGLHRTKRTVIVIYQTLYATIFRQISAKTMSGPLSIANASYKIAEYDFWQFLIFIGLININLAVVNFLPIPLLDGGHMVFLIYERIRGKPAPEKLQEWATWVGLAFILLLMAFVIFLDVRKLFF